ncbi:hypothetical protein DFH06DRAFT_1130533 [Mycena polygramma]|nr:hypothetical protein DFH06DRAFT_1130533 [Mycena polygramma]
MVNGNPGAWAKAAGRDDRSDTGRATISTSRSTRMAAENTRRRRLTNAMAVGTVSPRAGNDYTMRSIHWRNAVKEKPQLQRKNELTGYFLLLQSSSRENLEGGADPGLLSGIFTRYSNRKHSLVGPPRPLTCTKRHPRGAASRPPSLVSHSNAGSTALSFSISVTDSEGKVSWTAWRKVTKIRRGKVIPGPAVDAKRELTAISVSVKSNPSRPSISILCTLPTAPWGGGEKKKPDASDEVGVHADEGSWTLAIRLGVMRGTCAAGDERTMLSRRPRNDIDQEEKDLGQPWGRPKAAAFGGRDTLGMEAVTCSEYGGGEKEGEGEDKTWRGERNVGRRGVGEGERKRQAEGKRRERWVVGGEEDAMQSTGRMSEGREMSTASEWGVKKETQLGQGMRQESGEGAKKKGERGASLRGKTRKKGRPIYGDGINTGSREEKRR